MQMGRDVLRASRTALRGRRGWVLRLVITVALLGALLVKSDVRQLPSHLQEVNPLLLGAALVCSYVGWLINSHKWRQLLAIYGVRRRLRDLFQVNLATLLYGLVLPGQITGEALKAVRLARNTERREAVYVSVFLDRVTGVTALAFLGMIALLFEPPAETGLAVRDSCLILLGAVLLAGGAVLFLFRRHAPIPLIGLDQVGSIGIMAAHLRNLMATARGALGWRGLVVTLFWGGVFQATVIATNWLVAVALGIEVAPLALAWIVAVASMIQLAPISIAGIGPREGAYVGLLTLYAVPSGAALTMSLLLFGMFVVMGMTGSAMDLIRGEKTT